MRAVALAAFLALAVLAPAASAEPAATTLHLYVDPLADFPITPQAPPEGFVVSAGLGLASNTFTCTDNPPLARPFGASHTMRGYAYPEPVDFSRGDQVRFRPSRGIDDTVVLTGDPLVLHWYWAMDPAPGVPGGEQVPLAMPNVVVEATLRAGNAVSVDDEAYDSGTVIASGASGPATLAGPATEGATHTTVEGQSVYEFTIPMAVAAPVIPRDQGFNLRVDTYFMECGEGRVMPHAVALHSSPGHRPRIEAAVVDPLSAELGAGLTPAGELLVVAQPRSVFGSGDVANLTITVTGPDGAEVETEVMDTVTNGYGPCGHDCGHRMLLTHQRLLSDPAPGRYTATLAFTNQQGTALWTSTAEVSVEAQQEAPGLPAALVLAALAAAALALRRRR